MDKAKVNVPTRLVTKLNKSTEHTFFSLLYQTNTFTELKNITSKLPWFVDCLTTYLTIISDRLEELYPNCSDELHVGFVDWVLLQGNNTVQMLLNEENFFGNPMWWEDMNTKQLKQAQGHWNEK